MGEYLCNVLQLSKKAVVSVVGIVVGCFLVFVEQVGHKEVGWIAEIVFCGKGGKVKDGYEFEVEAIEEGVILKEDISFFFLE